MTSPIITGYFVGEQIELSDKETLFSFLLATEMRDSPITFNGVLSPEKTSPPNFRYKTQLRYRTDLERIGIGKEDLEYSLQEHDIVIVPRAFFHEDYDRKRVGIVLMKENEKLSSLLRIPSTNTTSNSEITTTGEVVTGQVLYDRLSVD